MKKMFKKLMSAFLALSMVLGIGAMPAFAAENVDTMANEIAVEVNDTETSAVQPRGLGTPILNTYFRFSNYQDSVKKYYGGNTITLVLSGIHCDGPGTFRVEVYRPGSDGKASGSMISQSPVYDSNNSDVTISWGSLGPGYYIFRFHKLSGTEKQHVESAVFYSY